MPRDASRIAFPLDEYAARVERTRAWMAEEGLDLLVVTQPEHYNWLSGYDPTAIFYFQALLVPADPARDLTLLYNQAEHGLYLETSWVDDVEVLWTYEDQIERTVTALRERELLADGLRVGMNLGGYNLPPKYVFALQAALPTVTIVDVTPGLDDLRLVKSPREIDYLRRAAHIADLGFTAGINAVRESAVDHDVMAAMQHAIALNGGEYPAFPFLVDARGVQHALPCGKVLRRGDLVQMEVSGVVRRYHCNFARMVSVGPASARLRELNDLVERIHLDAIELLRPGTSMEQIVDFQTEALGEFAANGWGRMGFGMEISYPPIWIGGLSIMKGDEHVLEPSMVITLETGIMRVAEGSLGLATNVLVTEERPEVLNGVSLELFER